MGGRRWYSVVCYTPHTSGSRGVGHWPQGCVVWLPVICCHLAVSRVCQWRRSGSGIWYASTREDVAGTPALWASYRGLWLGPSGQANGSSGPCGGVGSGSLGLAAELAQKDASSTGVAGARGALEFLHTSCTARHHRLHDYTLVDTSPHCGGCRGLLPL